MPRSPSRDVVDRFTGNRGYFHRMEPLRRWKNLAAIGAVGLVVGWLVVELAMPGKAANAHSHGELADPHAAFDSNCQACHAKHSPGDLLANPLSIFNTHDRWHDLTCTKCHAGPAHHASSKDESFHNRCSNCHHDHNGRGFSLVKLDDSHCVKCHADLPSAHTSGLTPFAKSVTGFTKDHPEFQSLVVDRGLKFSHAVHMTPGLVYSADDQHKWTPESLGKQFGADAKERYSGSGGDSAPLQLKCESCHQLDRARGRLSDPGEKRDFDLQWKATAGANRPAILPSRSEGAYYLPINFDLHCKSCHPLKTPAAKSGDTTIAEFVVRHRVQPSAMRPLIRGAYAEKLSTPSKKNPILNAPLGPGGRLDPKDEANIAKFGSELDRLTKSALTGLTQNLVPRPESGNAPTGGFACGKCHYSTAPGKTDVLALPDKSIWFEHAVFNHASHRTTACAVCHPGTGGSFTLNEREPPLILGVKSCQACHAKAGQTIELPTGQTASAAGIRHSCTDCHRYHNGDRPRQGLGSKHRDPVEGLNLEQFLNGGRGQP
jgi:hypothetical protein